MERAPGTSGHLLTGSEGALYRPLRTHVRSNLKQAIRRRQKRLENSMAHVRKPRPADLERWRRMEQEITKLQGILATLPKEADHAEG